MNNKTCELKMTYKVMTIISIFLAFLMAILLTVFMIFVGTAKPKVIKVESTLITPENEKLVVIDIKDREEGICADMYSEGFKWGLMQIPLQLSIWKMEEIKFEGTGLEMTKEEKALRLYDYVENINFD